MDSTFAAELLKDLTHKQLMDITFSSLSSIFDVDSLLGDIPPDIQLEEVLGKIAVEQGQSITVKVLRDQEAPLNVIVPQIGSTVLVLKKAIRRHFEIFQKRTKTSDVKISWRYIWRVYSLQHMGETMNSDNTLISEYGIINKSEIKFVKKKSKKGTPGYT